jgi:hypothetical protein
MHCGKTLPGLDQGIRIRKIQRHHVLDAQIRRNEGTGPEGDYNPGKRKTRMMGNINRHSGAVLWSPYQIVIGWGDVKRGDIIVV